jgi:hypothetical protein
LYANARGLINNKSDILQSISKLTPSILCLSETHVTDDIFDSEIEIKGFNMVHSKSHSKHTGGVSIFVREDLSFEIICNIVNSPMWWISGVKIRTEKGFFRIFVVYRSPSFSASAFLSFFENWLAEYEDLSSKSIIVGDFNINLNEKNEICRRTMDIIQINGFRQYVNFNTRISKTNASLIDFVVSDTYNISVTRLKKLKIGDHETIKINCEFFNVIKNAPKVLSFRDWKNMDYDTLNERLSNIEFNDTMNVNTKATLLCDELESAVANLLPHKVIYLKGRIDEPWHDAALKKQRDERDKIRERAYLASTEQKKSELLEVYNDKRNKYTRNCRNAEKQYLYDKIDSVKSDAKSMWKTLKEFVNESNSKNSNIKIKFDNNNNNSLEDNFNSFYVNSIQSIVESIPDASQNELHMSQNGTEEFSSNFSFKPINLNELVNIIKNLKSTAVPDNINLKVILNSLGVIQHLLLDIINSAIKEGNYPEIWKKSMVVPIPKVPVPKEPQDYRPINILPLCEKILEIVLHNQIVKYVKENKILYEWQSGFRQNHSCESSIQIVLARWRKLAEKGKVTIAAFLDFKRAFETIDRKLLLSKLKRYGFSEECLKLLGSFLSDRKQYVFANDKKSAEINVDIGVPQGSVLGPLLFILYINDLPLHLRDVLIKIFADDTLISASGNSYIEAANLLNSNLGKVNTWLKINKVKLNVSKSKYLIITVSKKKLTSLKNDCLNHPIKIDNEKLENVNVMKYLGVYIDSHLKFDDHVSYVLRKAGRKISYLGRIGKKLSRSTKTLIYNCIVAPHFDYCASILWNATDENIKKLQVLQNKAMRIILQCKRSTHVKDMLTRMDWLNIKHKLALQVLLLVKKILNGEVPSYLSDEVRYVNDIHNYSTRNKGDIYVSAVKSSFCNKSLFQSGFQLYNNLPTALKNIQQTKSFKKECIKYLKNDFTVL